MTTSKKVALGVGIALALGVGLYFIFKPKSKQNQIISDVEEDSNSDLFQTLADLFKKKPEPETPPPPPPTDEEKYFDEELYLQYKYPELSPQELLDLGLT
jgi:hypothetical protein